YQSTIPAALRLAQIGMKDVQTSGYLSCKMRLRGTQTTTHGGVSRRLLLKLKPVYQSVLGSPFQAQISGTLSPYTKDCFNAC
ncbi:MAG: hypothetical protein K5695_04015, partial [Oscillospiraceae bacterium]|nr:hypothetical protein [Oscillospiraceae bacterium]